MTHEHAYAREFDRLTVASITPEHHERTAGYWYLVTNAAMAHTAFATRAGLDRWLCERNLKLETELPDQGEYGLSRILGRYREECHLSVDEFESVRPVLATAELSNGDYTLGLIDEDADGIRTVHYLNPNVKTRLVFDAARTRKAMS